MIRFLLGTWAILIMRSGVKKINTEKKKKKKKLKNDLQLPGWFEILVHRNSKSVNQRISKTLHRDKHAAKLTNYRLSQWSSQTVRKPVCWGWDGSDKQPLHNDNVPRRNLIRMGWMSFTNSGYFAVIYLCLPSGGREGKRRPRLPD